MLKILYQDEHLIAVDKPSGMLVHRSWIDKAATQFLMQTLRDQIGQSVYTLHRLDKPTSGVMLFALDQETARLCSELFSEHIMEKTYLALVRGHTEKEGLIDYPLTRDTESRNQEKKEAKTRFRVLKSGTLDAAIGPYPSSRYSLLEVYPLTGRMHQIRRHLKHLRHPIIGDRKYGDRDHNRYFRETLKLEALFLMAKSIEFTHPVLQIRLCIEADWRPDFLEVQELINWE